MTGLTVDAIFDSVSFGILLRGLRERSGLTPRQLAEQSFCSDSYMRRLERDAEVPRLRLLVDIIAALELSETDTTRLVLAALRLAKER